MVRITQIRITHTHKHTKMN